MVTFKMGQDTEKEIVSRIQDSKEYIRIAVFQMHSEVIFSALLDRAGQGVNIEICTLPYDSINSDVRESVVERFERLKNAGVSIHFLPWNVGDPVRTTTAVGRWYAYHGKFMVTEKYAIIFSTNFLEHDEIEAFIIDDSTDLIQILNEKFNWLVKTFSLLSEDGQIGGFRKWVEEMIGNEEASHLFQFPDSINSTINEKSWILHYPSKICKIKDEDVSGMYITPFDARARNLFEKIISLADRFVYISTESFTDPDFCEFIIRQTRNRQLDIRILMGGTSMDFAERITDMYSNLLACGVAIYVPNSPLHAKLLVTEKYVLVSSVNLNKMNLGFKPKSSYWRSNIETIYVTSDLIEEAKSDFEKTIDASKRIEEFQIAKESKKLGGFFSDYDLRSQESAKQMVARFIVNERIQGKASILRLAKYINLYVERVHPSSKLVTKEDMLSCLVLHILSESGQTQSLIQQRLQDYGSIGDIDQAIKGLIAIKMIEENNGEIKLDLEYFLKGAA